MGLVGLTCALLSATFAGSAVAASWKIVATPRLPGPLADGQLLGVSCTSPKACVAVGSFISANNLQTLAERWNGQRWAVVASPNAPGASQSELRAVSCSDTRFCMAIGWHNDSAGIRHPLAEKWDGVKWSITPTPEPANSFTSELTGVSCRSANECVTVGNGASDPLAEGWDGTGWSLQTLAGAQNPARLSAVSCPTKTTCVAVGSETMFGIPFVVTFAERLDGNVWRIQPTPNVAEAHSSVLSGVSCQAGGRGCYAVGGWHLTFDKTLAARWDGVKWSLQRSDNAPGVDTLRAVSCVWPAGPCTAVGSTLRTIDRTVTLAERLRDGRWVAQPTANLPGPLELALNGVSCPTASSCMAVGSVFKKFEFTTLAERYGQ